MALKPAQMATNLPAYQREAVHDKSVSQSVNPPVSQSVSRSISQLVSVAENAWYSRGNTKLILGSLRKENSTPHPAPTIDLKKY